MPRSLEAMALSQLRRDQKEDKKMLMLSRLSSAEGGSLPFKLLSAKNWQDRKPKPPTFTKKILEDRDSNRALGAMKTISKRWLGKISAKGTLSFLANGHAADDTEEAPGEFSIFMFSPLDATSSSDPKSRILLVRLMFVSTELDEESIKYFAKNNFCLPDTLPGLEEQIFTCIKLLEKLTCRGGTASEGHWHGFNMLSRHKKEFRPLVTGNTGTVTFWEVWCAAAPTKRCTYHAMPSGGHSALTVTVPPIFGRNPGNSKTDVCGLPSTHTMTDFSLSCLRLRK
jgi:hypothetical protein